jgi:hypothetical protein
MEDYLQYSSLFHQFQLIFTPQNKVVTNEKRTDSVLIITNICTPVSHK